MNKVIIGSIIAVFLIVGAFFLTEESSPSAPTNNQPINGNTSQEPESSDSNNQQNELFTASQVAEHKTEQDCWTIINGSVYDITSYIPNHQGGDEILRACGIDGTSLFETRTTSDGEEVGSGTPHSDRAAGALESLKIGQLKS